MRWSFVLTFLLVAVGATACGRPGGTPASDSGGGSEEDDAAPRDAIDGEVDAAGDASTTSDGSTGDGGIVTGCAQPIKPTQVTTITSLSNLNFVEVFSAGDRVFATPPLANGTVWLRWTGTGWSEEPIPWPASLPAPRNVDRVVQLATGKTLIVSRRYLMTFDGTTMTAPVELPAISTPWAYAQSPTTGAYHVFHQALESVSKSDGTWHPAAPVPVQKLSNDPTAAATVMADGRIVVTWIDQVFGNVPRHVHVISRKPGTLWTADQDITPTWAVQAYGPYAFAPHGGGVVIGATGGGAGAVLWRSADGTTYGNYEPLGLIRVMGVAGPCLDALVATAGYQTRYDLLKLDGTSWSILQTRSLNYIDDARAAMLPDGRTFWALGESNRAEYYATP